jgi:cytochrome c
MRVLRPVAGLLAALSLAALSLAVPASAQTCNRQAFEPCQACHSLTTGGPQKPGPNLAGLLGRKVAGDPAFDYSPALKTARDKGDVWTKERLDIFLSDTEAMYPGGWMGSPPIRDAKQRADLLCVLAGP